MARVRLYTKAECSLCEDARDMLYRAKKQLPFELEEIDIRSSGELFARYRYQIPVIEIEGVERLTLKFTYEQLLQVL